MRRKTLAPTLAAFAFSAILAQSASAASYAIDPAHTSILFGVSHLGYSYTYGMFRTASGSFEFDPENPAACRFQATIDVGSIDTMNAKRDEHLKNADFFDAAKFPQITFTSSAVEKTTDPSGTDIYNVTGTLTMHGVSKEVTLPLTHVGEGEGPYGKYRVGFLCKTRIKRSDFGMEYMLGGIGDEVGVTISFEGTRQ